MSIQRVMAEACVAPRLYASSAKSVFLRCYKSLQSRYLCLQGLYKPVCQHLVSTLVEVVISPRKEDWRLAIGLVQSTAWIMNGDG